MSTLLSCQVEAARHATPAPAEGRAANADELLDAAVKRAIRCLERRLPNQFRVELLAGGRSAERLLGRDSVRHEPLVVIR
ncbi:hypothetical protein [Nocardioides campestrisoli]|uniref:hypothetical protein n=1 Tax=Nocardioides campestrisoli TaxID=2736757 RepID=UPI0015E64A00|nr:hypothetical protein [Nocardioides campestrisoli]